MAKPVRRVKALTDRPNPPAQTREQRLAEALRQNLRRRKAQARESESADADDRDTSAKS